MALSLDSISKKSAQLAPRILLCGVEKCGKSNWSCGASFDEDGQRASIGANSPIVLPMRGEEGVDGLGVSAFPTLGSYDEVLEAIGVLANEGHDYRTVVIDSVSALEPLVWKHVVESENKTNPKVDSIEKVGGGYGKGYVAAASAFRDLLEGLDHLRAERGMASILIGHVKVKRFDDPGGDSYDTYQLDLNDKVTNLLYRWADLILFANTKVIVKKEEVGFKKEKKRGIDASGGQRFLYTQKRPAHPGGGRGIYGQLPYELPLDYSAFEAAVSEAMSKQEATV